MRNWKESEKARWAVLPFVSIAGPGEGGRPSFWSVEASGNDHADLAVGREYAASLVKFMKETGDSEILALVFEDILRGADLAGVAPGFIDGIAEAIAQVIPRGMSPAAER